MRTWISPRTRGAALASVAALFGTTASQAWTIAMDNFDTYETGVAIKEQTDHAGVGFAGDWIETSGLVWWTPLAGTTTGKVYNGAVIQDGYGVISGGGRHMRALANVQSTGVVYASVLMMNIGGTTGSSQFHINGDAPIKDEGGVVTNAAADLIGGVRYDNGVIQIVDTSVLHVADNPETTEDESRNLAALLPGKDGLTDDDPPAVAYNEFYTLAETYVDISSRETPIDTDILWVIKYDIAGKKMSYYAFLPGDELTEAGASYSVVDMAVAAGRDKPLGAVSIAAWSSAVVYEHVKVGTTFRDVVPVYNQKASAPMARAAIVVDGVIDAEWDVIPAQSYGLKHSESQPANAADASGTWKAAWDAENLYLLFQVTDDEHFEGTDGREDQVEFWTDTNIARNNTDGGWPTVYDNTDTQWVTRFIDGAGNGFANRWQHGSSMLPAERKDLAALGLDPASGNGDDSMVVAGIVDGTSKIIEVSVAWADLGMAGPPMEGQMIGFETQLNDRDASTGVDAEQKPVYGSDGKAAWADGGNRAWLSPSVFGVLEFTAAVTPIIDYDFSDLTDKQMVTGSTGAADANWTGPFVEAWRTGAAQGWVLKPFVGDLAQGGLGIKASGMGRLSRTMTQTFDTGVVWTSFVISNDVGSTQLWLGDTAQFGVNSNTGIAAGVRMHNGSMQVINTALSRDTLENYVNVGFYPNAPVLVVISLDYDKNTVSYWLFESGLPIDPANPSAFYKFSTPRNTDVKPFSGIAWAGFFSNAVVSNFRVGENLDQVLPSAGMEYDCPVLVNALHEDVVVDGDVLDFAWERTNWLGLSNYWMDAGKNVLPADAADLNPRFHTGTYGNNLYIAVIVDDEDVRDSVAAGSRDAVEIYLDGDNSDSASLGWPTNYDQVDDYQLIFTLNSEHADGADVTGSWFGNPTGNPPGYKGPKGGVDQDFAGISWKVAPTASGYILEIAFDMTVVPGLDTFLANKSMGFDIAVVDFDDTGLLDEQDPPQPIVEKTQVFFCDDANWNWNGTAHFGTAHVAPAMPAIAWFGDGKADSVALAGDTAAGAAVSEVGTNFSDVTYVITTNKPEWVSIDLDPGIGAGEVEFSWLANPDLYQRTAQVNFTGATAYNRINLTQAGLAPEAMKAMFPNATPAESAGWAGAYLGFFYYGEYPWIYSFPMGWIYCDASLWMHSEVAGDWMYTTSSMWPWLYLNGEGTQAAGWKYAVHVDGMGIYLYDLSSGTWSQDPVFPEGDL